MEAAAEPQTCRGCWFRLPCLQLLRGVTISNGGVLPRIHPELLSKKRGVRVRAEGVAPPPERVEERPKSKKPHRKVKGQRGRKAKVSGAQSPSRSRARVLLSVLGLVTVLHHFLRQSAGSESVATSTVDDGPGDGFTILSAKSLFLGQKVTGHVTQVWPKIM